MQVLGLDVPPQILLLSHQVTAQAPPHASPLTGHKNLCASCEFKDGMSVVNLLFLSLLVLNPSKPSLFGSFKTKGVDLVAAATLILHF